MKKRKNTFAKAMAFIALLAIVIWIIGTWVLVLFNWWNPYSNQVEYSQEELEALIESFTWASVEVSDENIWDDWDNVVDQAEDSLENE